MLYQSNSIRQYSPMYACVHAYVHVHVHILSNNVKHNNSNLSCSMSALLITVALSYVNDIKRERTVWD